MKLEHIQRDAVSTVIDITSRDARRQEITGDQTAGRSGKPMRSAVC